MAGVRGADGGGAMTRRQTDSVVDTALQATAAHKDDDCVFLFPGDSHSHTLEPDRSHGRKRWPPPQFCLRSATCRAARPAFQIYDEDKRPAAKAGLFPPRYCRPVALINNSSPFCNAQSLWKRGSIYRDNLKGHESGAAARSVGKCTLPRLVFVQLGHSEEEWKRLSV